MSVEENKAIARRSVECINAHDLEGFAALLSAAYVCHYAAFPGGVANRERELQREAAGMKALADSHLEVADIIAEGDKVAIRFDIVGTHSGPYMGLPPTGKELRMPSMVIFRVADGVIQEEWQVVDRLVLLQQLGLAPGPEPVAG